MTTASSKASWVICSHSAKFWFRTFIFSRQEIGFPFWPIHTMESASPLALLSSRCGWAARSGEWGALEEGRSGRMVTRREAEKSAKNSEGAGKRNRSRFRKLKQNQAKAKSEKAKAKSEAGKKSGWPALQSGHAHVGGSARFGAGFGRGAARFDGAGGRPAPRKDSRNRPNRLPNASRRQSGPSASARSFASSPWACAPKRFAKTRRALILQALAGFQLSASWTARSAEGMRRLVM